MTLIFNDFRKESDFFCAKDANLFVTELREWNLPIHKDKSYYHSLLKYYTYVISDGYNSWTYEYPRPERKNMPFKDLKDFQLAPKIVIVPDGVNGLNICVHLANQSSSTIIPTIIQLLSIGSNSRTFLVEVQPHHHLISQYLYIYAEDLSTNTRQPSGRSWNSNV